MHPDTHHDKGYSNTANSEPEIRKRKRAYCKDPAELISLLYFPQKKSQIRNSLDVVQVPIAEASLVLTQMHLVGRSSHICHINNFFNTGLKLDYKNR